MKTGDVMVNVVIPARYNSQRLERKLLQKVFDKTVLQYTFEAAAACEGVSRVIVAVDHEELFDCASQFCENVVMTSRDCSSGTERLYEVVRNTNEIPDIWVNWQADEPLLGQRHMDALLAGFVHGDRKINTLASPFSSQESWQSEHNVKVVISATGRALYFSRAPIPGSKSPSVDGFDRNVVYHHIGLYAYQHCFWDLYPSINHSKLSEIESLEQLDWLCSDIPFGVSLIDHGHVVGIDTKKDLEAFREMVKDESF